jgi:hypothetical protein
MHQFHATNRNSLFNLHLRRGANGIFHVSNKNPQARTLVNETDGQALSYFLGFLIQQFSHRNIFDRKSGGIEDCDYVVVTSA